MTQQNDSTELYRNCRAFEKTHVCAQCGGILVTIYNDTKKDWINACGEDKTHAGIKRRLSEAEVVKRGELDKERGTGAQQGMEKFYETQMRRSPLMPTEDVATRVVLSPVQIKSLEIFADTIRLKAFLGHVCLYHGKPYITIDGYYYLKNKLGLPFAVITAPMTLAERKSYMIGEGDHAYLARAITSGGDTLNTGIGIVTLEEMETKSKKNPESFAAPVVHNKPQIMAEKRAEWQLLQKMISLRVDIHPEKTTPAPATSTPPIPQEEIDNLFE